jgi:hypothetical protein
MLCLLQAYGFPRLSRAPHFGTTAKYVHKILSIYHHEVILKSLVQYSFITVV